jgi:hypothetical protein
VALLLLGFIGLFVYVFRPMRQSQYNLPAAPSNNSATTTDAASTPAPSVDSPVSPSPRARFAPKNLPLSAERNTYINKKANVPSTLQSHFVAFSFEYPKSFEIQPPSEVNFVKIEKYAPAGKGNTAENFAVGYTWFEDPQNRSEAVYNQLLDQLGKQLSESFHDYKELKRTYTTVDGIRCRTSLFQADFKDDPSVLIYGRTIVVHPPGKKNGVTILLLGTSLSRDIKRSDDLGTSGETAEILKSFHFL